MVIASDLPVLSAPMSNVKPVTLPPGRASDDTTPMRPGSPTKKVTIGTDCVALRAASNAGEGCATEAHARALGLSLVPVGVRTPEEFAPALERMTRERSDHSPRASED